MRIFGIDMARIRLQHIDKSAFPWFFHVSYSSFSETGWKFPNESLVADFQWCLWCTLHLVCGISRASTLEGGRLPSYRGGPGWAVRGYQEFTNHMKILSTTSRNLISYPLENGQEFTRRIPSFGRMTISHECHFLTMPRYQRSYNPRRSIDIWDDK